MEGIQIDWMAVSIAVFLNRVVGSVWYSKWLFGAGGKKEMSPLSRKTIPFISELAVSFVIAFFLAFFEGHLRVTTVSDGMFVGFCVWLGFVATTQISPVIWQNKTFKLFFIDTGYKLLSFLMMGGILGA